MLKPGGRVAFATWPPEHFVGRMFAFISRHSPPPPPGVAPPPQWGVPAIIAERLAPGFHAPFFSRGVMMFNALSIEHFREFMEQAIGPMRKLVEGLAGHREKLDAVRREFVALADPYYVDNQMVQEYLFTRALAR